MVLKMPGLVLAEYLLLIKSVVHMLSQLNFYYEKQVFLNIQNFLIKFVIDKANILDFCRFGNDMKGFVVFYFLYHTSYIRCS